MLLTNARVHADNPEFQRDMLATVRASVGKITRLLTRLQADRREREPCADPAVAHRLTGIVAAAGQSPERISSCPMTAAAPAWRSIPEPFDAAVGHLLNNAAEASAPGGPVHIRLRRRRRAWSWISSTRDRDDAGVHPRRVVPPVQHYQRRRPRHRRLAGAGTAARRRRRPAVMSRPGAGTTMRLMLPRSASAGADRGSGGLTQRHRHDQAEAADRRG